MEPDSSLAWLMSNAGPAIKYRTVTELLGKDSKSAEKDLLSSSLVNFWLANLKPGLDRNDLHGAKTETYENAMERLFEFGLKKGKPVLDKKTELFRRWLRTRVDPLRERYFPIFHRTLVAAFLAMTGYADDEAVKEWTIRRLETIYPTAKEGTLTEVYVPNDFFPSFPKTFKNVPLINPELYLKDEFRLPWIHDINAFLHSPFILEDSTLRSKVERIIEFILTPEYQKLPWGYGVIRHESGRYYAMGWSVHLSGYFETPAPIQHSGRWLLLLRLLARSRTVRGHAWYERSLETLRQFKCEDGLVRFPRAFLPEKRIGCWVLGMRMGLEENRRTQKVMTCESTFRFLEITLQSARG
jgi:hypothetical protein